MIYPHHFHMDQEVLLGMYGNMERCLVRREPKKKGRVCALGDFAGVCIASVTEPFKHDAGYLSLDAGWGSLHQHQAASIDAPRS